MSYAIRSRNKGLAAETLTATITDANGISSVATATLGAKGGSKEAFGYGGAGGAFGSVGIEQTVDEWQCAQDSAIGFKNVMASHSQSVAFDWRGANAWEQDFHKTSTGGHDNQWVDSVDAQWYTGHGNSGGFTFKSNVPDGSIVPSDARWGDNFNLEWMQLESCQVLRDTNGHADYFGRWAQAFDGLHLLNGFDTNATCVGGGTGGRFASYLFPTFWRGALSVSQAWSAMANDLEPGGTKWRSISPIGPGGSFNLNDRYWGQGTTGPDIPASVRTGFIAISGTGAAAKRQTAPDLHRCRSGAVPLLPRLGLEPTTGLPVRWLRAPRPDGDHARRVRSSGLFRQVDLDDGAFCLPDRQADYLRLPVARGHSRAGVVHLPVPGGTPGRSPIGRPRSAWRPRCSGGDRG